MSTESSVSAASSATNIAVQVAILAVESDQADCEAQTAIRAAEQAAKYEHQRQQAEELRDKAHDLVLNGVVTGSLTALSSVSQFAAANSKYDADVATAGNSPACNGRDTIDRLDKAAAINADATRYNAASTLIQGSAKTSDLLFSSIVSSDEADAAAEGNQAQNAQTAADDANAAHQRALAQLDDKLSIAQELLRSDADTMHLLIRPA